MKIKIVSLSLLLMFVLVVSSYAAVPKKKTVAIKKTPVKKEAIKKESVKVEVPEEDKLADLKDDMNTAIADLKGQIDKVKQDNSDMKVSSTLFFRFQKYLSNGASTTPNNFDVERAYLDFKKKLDWGASARVTLDISRLDTAKVDTDKKSQHLFDYLKYAYVEMPINIPSYLQVVPVTLTAKLGLQHTVWIDWMDKVMELRYIAKTIVDNEGIMSSADFGIGATGKVAVLGVPEVEYHATLINGSGYKAAADIQNLTGGSSVLYLHLFAAI
ncbi:hypothetical protein HZC34_07030 [Candidatus Saganbacteria bacterium]|nr:hypothetical protein [Candidatus Saganbacteria bacterium]